MDADDAPQVLSAEEAALVDFPVYGPQQWRACGRAVYTAMVGDDGVVHDVGLAHQLLIDGEIAYLSVISARGQAPVIGRAVRWPDADPALVPVDLMAYVTDSLIA